MSEKKSKRPRTDYDDLEKYLLNQWDEIDARNEADYDGVMGCLPEWVPEPIQFEFARVRNRVLDIWQYEHSVAVDWVNKYVNNDEIFYPAIYPNERDLDLYFFGDTFGYLAQLKWATSLEPEHGIYKLAGEYARQGYRNSMNRKPRSVTTLTLLMEETYKNLLKFDKEPPSARKVRDNLETYDSPTNRTIDYIDEINKFIKWIDIKNKPQETGFGQFNNKVSAIKKRIFRVTDKP